MGVRGISVEFKDFDEIKILAMHIATNGDLAAFWNVYTDQVRLCFKELFGRIKNLKIVILKVIQLVIPYRRLSLKDDAPI